MVTLPLPVAAGIALPFLYGDELTSKEKCCQAVVK